MEGNYTGDVICYRCIKKSELLVTILALEKQEVFHAQTKSVLTKYTSKYVRTTVATKNNLSVQKDRQKCLS